MFRLHTLGEMTGHAAEPPRQTGTQQPNPRRGERRGVVGKFVNTVATTLRNAGFAEAAGVSPYPRDEQ